MLHVPLPPCPLPVLDLGPASRPGLPALLETEMGVPSLPVWWSSAWGPVSPESSAAAPGKGEQSPASRNCSLFPKVP